MELLEFRVRDYEAEEAAHSLPRIPTHNNHPLLFIIIPPSSTNHHHHNQVDSGSFYDPLRGGPTVSLQDYYNNNNTVYVEDTPSDEQWLSFKRSIMQKLSSSKTVSISPISDVIIKSGKAYEKSLEELENPQKDGLKVITRQEYVSRLRQLKDEIGKAWKDDDRVTSLKLTIKVARLLMDTSVSEFYPPLFILVIDVMDMLGDMVWERIKRKAEYADDGTLISSLPDDFGAKDVRSDAKETCYNWFCKIGSIPELLPRIYLELAILRCWRFVHEQPCGIFHRLVMMIRGLADPLASFYCRLYMVRCAQKMLPHDTGYLFTCVGDIKIILTSIILEKETTHKKLWENKKSLISMLEPTIEWIMKCMCKDLDKTLFEEMLVELQLGRELSNSSGAFQYISVILHYFLKELPAEIVCSRASCIVQLIESTNDISLEQYLNFRLLGLKLFEGNPHMDYVCTVLAKVFQGVSQYNSLNEYLEVVDAFLDIVLKYNMDNYLTIILDGISVRACSKGITESEMNSLQSIFVKLLAYYSYLEDAFALNHFVEILRVMYGSTRDVVYMQIVSKATREGYIRNPTTIQLLFEVSLALHDRIDILDIKDDYYQQCVHLISRFVHMVDYGAAMERHLTFLIECRGAFVKFNELMEVLVHSSNNLAVKAIKDANGVVSFLKSCIAFNEVTIPSISATTTRMNLYLETVEVALLGGLLSHMDDLIDLAIGCLQSLNQSDGSLLHDDVNELFSLIRKLCSLLVIIPGNPEQGVAYLSRSILSLVESHSWIAPQLRLRVFCAILSMAATLSQNKFPYHACNKEVVGNDLLFFGDCTYRQELASLASTVLTKVFEDVLQEPHQVTRGSMALEACNCILSSLKGNDKISEMCSKLIEIAKLCLDSSDNYLRSTVCLLDKHFSNLLGVVGEGDVPSSSYGNTL